MEETQTGTAAKAQPSFDEFLKRYTDRKGEDGIFRGHTFRDMYDVCWPLGAVQADFGNDGYRCIYLLQEKFAIVTYCEGDIDVTVDLGIHTYNDRLASAKAFYGDL